MSITKSARAGAAPGLLLDRDAIGDWSIDGQRMGAPASVKRLIRVSSSRPENHPQGPRANSATAIDQCHQGGGVKPLACTSRPIARRCDATTGDDAVGAANKAGSSPGADCQRFPAMVLKDF